MLEDQLLYHSSTVFPSTLLSPLLLPSHSLPDHLPPSPPLPLPSLLSPPSFPPHSLPSPSPPVLQFHEVVANSDSHQVGVVGRGGDGHRPSAPDIGVTQLVRQCLDVISCEVIVIPQHMVMGRLRRTLVGGEEVGEEGRGGKRRGGEGRGAKS